MTNEMFRDTYHEDVIEFFDELNDDDLFPLDSFRRVGRKSCKCDGKCTLEGGGGL